MIDSKIIMFFCSVGLGLFILVCVVIGLDLVVMTYQRICGTPTDKLLLKEKTEQLAYAKMLVESQKDKIKFLEKTLRKRNKECAELERKLNERQESV